MIFKKYIEKFRKKIIDKVSESGAQMIKFQTFDPEEMTINLKKNIFKIRNNIRKK